MPTGATHPYVSNLDDPTLHPTLWHGHVVVGHGGPVPLDSRNPTPQHRDAPHRYACTMGVAQPILIICGASPSLSPWSSKVFSLRLVLCTRATPRTRRTSHAIDFGLAASWPDNIPEAQVEQQAKPRCRLCAAERLAEHRKSGEKTPRTHKGRTLDESEPVDR